MKARIPMPIEAAPIVMSIRAIRIRTNFKEIKPKHTPLAIGTNLKNLGSLSSSFKSPPVISKGLCWWSKLNCYSWSIISPWVTPLLLFSISEFLPFKTLSFLGDTMSVIIIWSDIFPLAIFTSLTSSSYNFALGDYSAYLLPVFAHIPLTFIVINVN